jgi:uncharacterized protein (DUF3820 family)
MSWRDRSSSPPARIPSPPPLKERPRSDDDGDSWDWYYNDPGGGTILNFGIYQGQALNETGWGYLQWCRQNLGYKVSHLIANYGLRWTYRRRQTRFINAFEVYREGLEGVVDDLYDQFVVPFGKKHRGKEIRQCRDKEWLLWTMEQKGLVDKARISRMSLGQTLLI